MADLCDGLAYREAFTTDAAQAVVAYLVNDRGLEPDRAAATKAERSSALHHATEAERSSALHDAAEAGRLVFVYRKPRPAPAALPSDHATLPKLAA